MTVVACKHLCYYCLHMPDIARDKWRAAVSEWVLTLAHPPEEETLEDYVDQLVYDIDAKLITLERDARYIDPEYSMSDHVRSYVRALFCSAAYDMYAETMPEHMLARRPEMPVHHLTIKEAKRELAAYWEEHAEPVFLRYAAHPILSSIKDTF